VNVPIRRIIVVFGLLFLALLWNVEYVQVIQAGSLSKRSDNRRVLLDEYARERGPILVGGDPIAQSVITSIKPDAEDLSVYYEEGKQRIHAYEAMIQHILALVRSGKLTVGAFYGHPGVFAYPSHESIRRLRQEGYAAKMLPGISAEDCMFADLGVDPAVGGMQTYEATDFLINGPIIDNSTQLVIWQIGTLGDLTYRRNKYDTSAMPILVKGKRGRTAREGTKKR